MRIAVCPGSFDPVTKGHLDIITRAAKLFDRVIVLVSINRAKQTSFDVKERLELLQAATEGIENVVVDANDGLLADYVAQSGACAIVKGLRAISDFDYEFQMALMNKKMVEQAETVFLTTNAEHLYLSSSLVKQIAYFGGDISDFVPACILEPVKKRLYRKGE
ncbi:MAG: pantetheine-phosphate adenylyltransferase [Oscillospiraceae bacterium]|nr:pantetheine-phosphate adenylyltransferase [Oscillospiraceae bacterium]